MYPQGRLRGLLCFGGAQDEQRNSGVRRLIQSRRTAWSALISPEAGGDLKPERFGSAQLLGNRPGADGFGARYYRIVDGSLEDNFIAIQRSADAPDGVKAIIKNPEFMKHAPQELIAPVWRELLNLEQE